MKKISILILIVIISTSCTITKKQLLQANRDLLYKIERLELNREIDINYSKGILTQEEWQSLIMGTDDVIRSQKYTDEAFYYISKKDYWKQISQEAKKESKEQPCKFILLLNKLTLLYGPQWPFVFR